jgi:hypothetical protein
MKLQIVQALDLYLESEFDQYHFFYFENYEAQLLSESFSVYVVNLFLDEVVFLIMQLL